jgi:hypothetical protein
MMGLGRKHSWDKMCPWGWTMIRENVSLRRRWAGEKMCRARKRMWPGGKDGPKDDAQGGNGAGKKMVPEDDLVLRRG